MSLKYKLPVGYEIREIPDAEFWNLWTQPAKKIFNDVSMFYLPKEVFTKSELAKVTQLRDDFKNPKAFKLNLGLYYKNKFVGWSWGFQESATVYYMCNSAILPQHRKKGLYTCLMKETLHRIKDKGFSRIYSRHIITNNDIIIAKLKAGFKITHFELAEQFGTMVQLSYYFNQMQNEILDFRSGLKRPTKKVKKAFSL